MERVILRMSSSVALQVVLIFSILAAADHRARRSWQVSAVFSMFVRGDEG